MKLVHGNRSTGREAEAQGMLPKVLLICTGLVWFGFWPPVPAQAETTPAQLKPPQCPNSPKESEAVQISGELKQWHRVSLTFQGPETGETAQPNPFRDYRLQVEFRCGQRRYVVAGFYAADGNAAQTGADRGRCWRVNFCPDQAGQWTYRVSFRTGPDVAIQDDPKAGRPTAFDGLEGTFQVAPSDKKAPDFRAKGRLEYVGQHYLRFAGTGEFFIKGGTDSPENFLAYADFDGTYRLPKAKRKPRTGEANPREGLHRYLPHLPDWRPGDPTWRDGLGKGIIGALNYLGAQGVNSVYFITMNVEGDGQDVWPWISPTQRDRFDCSKLDQWEIVFSHMDQVGILLHVVTQEQENDQLLDGGELGPERKLYYRELVARFAHHLGLVWNLGEENTNTDAQRRQFAQYIHRLDPYGHPIVVHTFPGQYEKVYQPLLGFPHFHGPSLQMGNMRQTYQETLRWVQRSAQAGRKWIVCLDEIGPAEVGVQPDSVDPTHHEVRRYALWANLMAGGAGCEWYFGYKYPHNDLTCEDFRSRENLWTQTRYARQFFERLPLERMRPEPKLVRPASAWCFAEPGEIYVVYLPEGGTAELDLKSGSYTVQWYNPREGGPLRTGSIRTVQGPGFRSLGKPPTDPDQDWAVLVQRIPKQSN